MVYAETARDLRLDLKDRFSQGNGPRIYEIKRSIATLQQEQMSVVTYFSSLKVLWDELGSCSKISPRTCGSFKELQECQQTEKVYQFLMRLNESFGTIHTQILAMEHLLNIGKVYSLVLQEEKHKGLQVNQLSSSDAAALAVNKQEGCGFRETPRATGKPYCTHCPKHGHTRETCYDLHGYRAGHPKRNSNGRFNPQQGGRRNNNVHSNANPGANLSIDASQQGGMSSQAHFTASQYQLLC